MAENPPKLAEPVNDNEAEIIENQGKGESVVFPMTEAQDAD